jgi:hypothetical protein
VLSGVELSAAFNVVVSVISGLLGLWFIRRLWRDVLEHRDIGAVGFTMVFVTAFLFNVWDAATYSMLVLNGGDAAAVLPFTQVKPFIHAFEIFSYLLLYLHFKK